MNPIALGLIALGGIIQVAGILFALLGSEGIHIPLLVGALVLGGLIEGAGIVVMGTTSRR